ncbi:MAG: TraR/DksA family transcriptional regulator [Thermodesulfobacteriota bacterium]
MKEREIMWMTREEIADRLGVVPNSIRGKVKKGQIERKAIDGKNLYRILDPELLSKSTPEPEPPRSPAPPRLTEPKVTEPKPLSIAASSTPGAFNPRQVLLELLSSIKVGRSIDAIEKGDEIDLATDEISRELDARISMRQHRQIQEIEDALERLKHGDYGLCEDCGEPIPEQRLRLFPAARLCVRCQEEADRYEKMKEDPSLRGGAWREEPAEGGYIKTFEE